MHPQKDEDDFRLSSGFAKNPPRRGADQAFNSSYKWLKSKAESDAVGPFWRVHDKIYDLTNFIPKHPGGRFWIEATRGCDVTESFESSHFGRAPYEILEKFYVKEADWPRNSPFTFQQDDFYMTLKRKVTPILRKTGKGPSLESFLIQDGLLVLFLSCLTLGGWYQSHILLIAAGISLSMAAFCAHNFFHQRDNWRMYIFDAFLVSSKEWRISHAMSHHNFTNTIYDYELESLEPHLYFLPKQDKPTWQLIFILPLMVILTFYVDTFRRIFITRKNGWSALLPFIQVAFLLATSPTFTEGLLNSLIFHLSASLYFIGVGLTVAHHHPDIFREGDKLPRNRDWGLLQVFATRERGFVINSTFLSAISFGNHTLHHLFPTVDMAKLNFLLEPFVETCEEFGVEFKMMTIWELFKGALKALVATNSNKELPNIIKKGRNNNPLID